MMRSDAIDSAFYKTAQEESSEEKFDELLPLQKEIFEYIRENHIVTGKSIRAHFLFRLDHVDLEYYLQEMFNKGFVFKVLTKKQAEECGRLHNAMIITEDEERTAKIQEKTEELHALGEEYSSKQRELNRTFEKQEMARQELAELCKANDSNHDWKVR